MWWWIGGLTGGGALLLLLCCGGLFVVANRQIEAEGRARLEQAQRQAESGETLAEAVAGFNTTLGPPGPIEDPPEEPPPGAPFALVSYPSPVGDLPAYLTAEVAEGTLDPNARRTAIVWITGGDCNTIGPVWEPGPPEDDQTASAFREAGVMMLFPSLRGGNANPGRREGFLGEVEDVLAAAEFLAAQPGVDPDRIYLGGHSTGGTLAALVAERSDRFRATFAFGPVFDVRDYGGDYLYHVPRNDEREALVRSPGYWLNDVRTPLFLIEGAGGNADSLRELQRATDNPRVRCLVVPNADHFDVLAPANAAIAEQILADDGPTCDIALTAEELAGGR
ncbi:alpha/beta hydrolase family protein [Alienimonas californiensis]|uniref:alpha/beta hydrolase family protein n=1 Tax=Alienimonas californiensis TaxID=2527989 RepID=UPI001A98A570|nr:prolyl oligopeptidase family serine peptidase [Alienimonas californiensis]